MVGSLEVPFYFKAHACLDAYTNTGILRRKSRNLTTRCITSQTVACDVTAVDPISVQHCWWRRLLKQASNERM